MAQDQKLADSLRYAYDEGNFENELEVLQKISEYESDPSIALNYSEILIEKAIKRSEYGFAHSGFLQKGNHLQSLGNYTEALQAYFESEKQADLADDNLGKAGVLISIADTYSEMGNSRNAKSYYRRGLKEIRVLNDSIVLGTTLLNAGDEYLKTKHYDSAMHYFEESKLIFQKLEIPIGLAYNYGNSGMVYAETGRDSLAEKNILAAIDILEELEDYHPIAVYLTYLSDIYIRKNNTEMAFYYADKSLSLARKQDLKKEISAAHLKLAQLNKAVGNFEEAYGHYENYVVYRDSIKNITAVQEMARLRTENEIAKKQNEVDLLAQKEKTQKAVMIATGIALLLIGSIAFGLFRRNKFISRTKEIIEKERNRSDQLLQNILPEETALELKNSGKVKSKRFDSVSVLFADFVGFTKYSEQLSPEEVVDSVDFYFSKFDEIIEKYKLEKIKTLGDCYMCAGGLPFPVKDHAQRLVLAAFEMIEFVRHFKAKSEIDSKEVVFNMKIGINSGPVVAGVVGTKKFAYDIWGDTVNIASRMESLSEPGQINISDSTCNLIREDFICEYRGEMEVKNRAVMKMYFVKGVKEKSRKSILAEANSSNQKGI
ncbi:adenylate/guanylate cyclase domain-containing protein [Gramella lutea]|uniref:Adenylate/guanylate cyclase domain-containing protein n=1 Tax=Christiangramia lutea TaxID=1607951 RepID=A0A9X1V3Q1_9FLAO|nr:adenylate/guanylate cyclase domain-containing protein [Christiangramia lutea]MCH4823101.1 adenylate/guanylate cyclase domain-containing protein [Christiangramia lutea]